MKRSTIITGRMTKAVKTSSLSKLIYRFSGIRSEILAGFFLMATDKLIFKNSHVSANEQALPSVKGELTDLHWDSGLFTKAQPWQQCKNGSVTRRECPVPRYTVTKAPSRRTGTGWPSQQMVLEKLNTHTEKASEP